MQGLFTGNFIRHCVNELARFDVDLALQLRSVDFKDAGIAAKTFDLDDVGQPDLRNAPENPSRCFQVIESFNTLKINCKPSRVAGFSRKSSAPAARQLARCVSLACAVRITFFSSGCLL